jgi:hypothetical protein
MQISRKLKTVTCNDEALQSRFRQHHASVWTSSLTLARASAVAVERGMYDLFERIESAF